MQFNRVLVLVTGSPTDKAAVSHAVAMTRENRGRLIILYVICVDRSLELDTEIPEEVEKAEEALSAAEAQAHLQRIVVEAEMLQAREIGSAVVHEAAVRDVDAVVLATRYPTHNGKFDMGADIPYILEYSASNVVLVRESLDGAKPGSETASGRSEQNGA